jgi:hypothetical protein
VLAFELEGDTPCRHCVSLVSSVAFISL